VVLVARNVVQKEYLAPPDSYPRVEKTKNALDASCTPLRLRIHVAQTLASDYRILNSPLQCSSAIM
jgi:hypothetical protein